MFPNRTLPSLTLDINIFAKYVCVGRVRVCVCGGGGGKGVITKLRTEWKTVSIRMPQLIMSYQI